jgi:hypothetical protein
MPRRLAGARERRLPPEDETRETMSRKNRRSRKNHNACGENATHWRRLLGQRPIAIGPILHPTRLRSRRAAILFQNAVFTNGTLAVFATNGITYGKPQDKVRARETPLRETFSASAHRSTILVVAPVVDGYDEAC